MKFNEIKNKIKSINLKKDKKKEKEILMEEELLRYIEPNEITIEENFGVIDGRYCACLTVSGFPLEVSPFWLDTITRLDDTITKIDIKTVDNKEYKKLLSAAIDEQRLREKVDDNIISSEASILREKLEQSLDNVINNEAVKKVAIRIYISGESIDDITQKFDEIKGTIEDKGYLVRPELNQFRNDYTALFEPLDEIDNMKNVNSISRSMENTTLSGGYCFNQDSLNDPLGFYLGRSDSGGSVVWFPFTKTGIRKSYNGIFIGKLGTGKTTLIKTIAYNLRLANTSARIADASGEFLGMCKKLNGQYVDLDGSTVAINPLQIYATFIDEKRLRSEKNTDEENQEILSRLYYQNHSAKLNVIYRYFMPNADDDAINLLSNCTTLLYLKKGILKGNLKKVIYSGCETYRDNDYPILSELLEMIDELKDRENLRDSDYRLYNSISLALSKIITNYGSIFNRKSTIDLSNRIIVFNTKGISNLEDNIYNSIMFNLFSILENEMISNKVQRGEEIKDKEKEIRESKKYLVIFDEAHRVLNTSTDQANMKIIDTMCREARKYFGAIWFSFHNIKDVMKKSGNMEDVESIFDLTTYTILLEQDSNSLEALERVFGSYLSAEELKKITSFKTGECILCIKQFKNIFLTVELGSERQRSIVATGGV